MKVRIKSWYEGEFVPRQNDPNSALFFLNGGQAKRHWTATFIHWAIVFWLREWKWVIGTALAIIGVFIAYAKM